MSKLFYRGISILFMIISCAFAAENTTVPTELKFVPCKGAYVLCYYAKCKLNDNGTASCGCVLFNDEENYSFVNVNDIYSKSLKQETLAKCPNGLASCPSGEAPICQTMQTTLMSTFSLGNPVFHFDGIKICAKGKFANCMTSHCEQKTSFDGSPITCTCKIEDDEFSIAKTNDNDCSTTKGLIWSGVPIHN